MTGSGKAHYLILGTLIGSLLLLLGPSACFGAILVGRGNDPVADLGWPLGSVEMANLPTRVGWWEGPPFGGGEYHFSYRCRTTMDFNQALQVFSSIRAPRLEVVIHDGPGYDQFLESEGGTQPKADTRVDWTFTVWHPESWHRLYNNPTRGFLGSVSPNFRQPVAAPRVDVYVGGGSIAWEQVRIPPALTVIDHRAAAAPVKPVGGGLLQGDVFDMSTGRPVAGAEIVLSRLVGEERRQQWEEAMRAPTDDLGSFQIEKIPPGRYRIGISAQGYASRAAGDYVNEGNTYQHLVSELARGASIKGVVTDLAGKPLPGVAVSADAVLAIDGRGYEVPGGASATTDDQGRFEINSLPIGYTQLRCRTPSLYPANPFFEIYSVPSESTRLVMTRTGTIRGKVLDKAGKVPSGQVLIHVRPVGEQIGKWGGSTTCQPDGSFEFTGVPPGQYLVGTDARIVTGLSEKAKAQRVSVEPGQTLVLDIVQSGP